MMHYQICVNKNEYIIWKFAFDNWQGLHLSPDY